MSFLAVIDLRLSPQKLVRSTSLLFKDDLKPLRINREAGAHERGPVHCARSFNSDYCDDNLRRSRPGSGILYHLLALSG